MKNVVALGILLFLLMQAKSQGMVVNVGMGYAFRCSFDAFHDTANYYSAEVKEGIKYTVEGGYQVDRNFSANLSIQYQRTTVHADARYAGSNISPDLKTSLWWIQGGGTSYLRAGHLILFFGTYAGVGLYHFSDLPSSPKKSPVRFAWSVRAGTGFFITNRLALNVRGEAIFTTDPLSKEFSDPTAPSGHTGYNSFSQLSFLAGITYQFFQSAPKPKK